MTLLQSINRLSNGFINYANPLQLGFQRVMKRPQVTAVDRHTNLTFRAKASASILLPETLHMRVYDIPGVPLRPGDIVMDIGANQGFYSCYAGYQGATVYAFEPDQNSLPLLQKNIADNGLAQHVTVLPYAVSSETGTVDFYSTERLGGGQSSIMSDFVEQLGLKTNHVRVEAYNFQDALALCNNPERIRLVKVDCEGAELGIFRTLTPDVLDRIDAFAIEFHPEAYDLNEFINLVMSWEDFNTSIYRISDLNILHITRKSTLKEWFRQQTA